MLALDFRPRAFSDVVGQRHIVPVLRAMCRDRTAPAALVFSGSRGTGKTSSARILAAALNCEKAPELNGDPCAECPSCVAVQNGASLNVIEIDAASHGLVDDIRALSEAVSYDHGGGYRVVVLDEVQSMERRAFNAFLKTLEEPPAQTCFVLLTTQPARIPDTVLSRAMLFEFRRIALADIVDRLRQVAEAREQPSDEALLAEIARRARGGMRDAVMLLEQVWRAGVADIAGLREMVGDPDVSLRLLQAAKQGDYAAAHGCVEEHFNRTGDGGQLTADLSALVRDLLVLKAGGVPKALSDADLQARRGLAAQCSEAGLAGAMKVLWEVRGKARPREWDQRAVTDMAVVLLIDALSGRRVEKGEADTRAVARNGSRRLTLTEMAQMLEDVSGQAAG